jgi:hypothetical protein
MVQSNAPAEIYQLHILLLQINPPIWRRLHVRSDSSIATLHEVLQIAFDWSDFHLHRFVIRGKEYGLSRIGCTTFGIDARKELLSQFHFRVNERFLYEYDFGDLWQHQIRFEGIQPVCEKKLYPVCVGGACASPPEDCGGPETKGCRKAGKASSLTCEPENIPMPPPWSVPRPRVSMRHRR